MKQRASGFLAKEHIDHDSEAFDYIRELHDYLWRFVRVHIPGAGGDLGNFLDEAIIAAEKE